MLECIEIFIENGHRTSRAGTMHPNVDLCPKYFGALHLRTSVLNQSFYKYFASLPQFNSIFAFFVGSVGYDGSWRQLLYIPLCE
jgi:hypothetical protein